MTVLKRSVMLMLALGLAACGASYKTDYRFVAPNTLQGSHCASTCLQNRQICDQQCDQQQSQCETADQVKSSLNQYAMQQYSAGHFSDYPAYMGLANIDAPSCQHVDRCPDHCAAAYRDCFTVCGGQVIPYQVCEANCP